MGNREKPDEDRERLEVIAELVRNGTYPLDYERLAEAILEHPTARTRLGLAEDSDSSRLS